MASGATAGVRVAHRCRADNKNASCPTGRHHAVRAGRTAHDGRGDQPRRDEDGTATLAVSASVRPLTVPPPIERRQARQRIPEECGSQALLIAQLFAAITLSYCQRIGPKTRRNRSQRNVGKQFGHFSFPRLTSHAAPLGHASTLAKAGRSPVAIGTKSGRHRRAPPLFFLVRPSC